MAKAGFWLRGAKGKLAGSTLFSSKGSTIIREIKKDPKNPRTEAQMTQRSQFLAAVRFYQRANQRFFKFAFENKRKGESDYNAFMRLNAGLGAYITKPQSDAVGFPMIGPYTVTQGSLVAPTYGMDMYLTEDTRAQLLIAKAADPDKTPDTIGKLSADMLEFYPEYRAGDIVTFVTLYSSSTGEFYNDLDAERYKISSDRVQWNIIQFILDTEDTRPISVIGLSYDYSDDNDLYVYSALGPMNVIGGCIACVSRNEAGGLKVSTSQVSLSVAAEQAYIAMRSDEHLSKVLTWWGASQQAILQGAVAKAGDKSNELKVAYVGDEPDEPLPFDSFDLLQGSIEGINVVFTGDARGVTLSDFSSDGSDNWMWNFKHYTETLTSLEFSIFYNATPGKYGIYYKNQLILYVLISKRN